MIELIVRVVFSLVAVVGLMLLIARWSSRRFQSGAGSALKVLQRQSLSRTSSIAIVEAGSKVLVVGTTENTVSLLAELDHAELDHPVPDQVGLDVAAVDSRPVSSATSAPPAPSAASALVGDGLDRSLFDPADFAVAPQTREQRRPLGALRFGRQGDRHQKASAATTTSVASRPVSEARGPLAGSVLSIDTWRQAFSAVQRGA